MDYYILAQQDLPLVYLYDGNAVVQTVKSQNPNELEPELETLVIKCYSEYGARYQLGRIRSGWYAVDSVVYAGIESAVKAAQERQF